MPTPKEPFNGHTPLPWHLPTDDDAAFIVQAVNTYYDREELIAELVEALKYSRRFLKPADHDVSYVDSVLAKAHSLTKKNG